MLLQMKKMRLRAVMLLPAVCLVLLSGCSWLGQTDRKSEQDKTYIIVVDTKHPVLSNLDRIPGELDALLGEDWALNSQPVIIICQ